MKAGITGHQELGDQSTISWVREGIAGVVDASSVAHGFTCLAAGADQLFARVLLERKIPYTVVVPSSGYEGTFPDPPARTEYRHLLERAEARVELAFPEPGEEAYWAAGREVVRLAELLIAVWNGRPAAGLGGTGDVVRHARQVGRRVWHLNPLTRNAQWVVDA